MAKHSWEMRQLQPSGRLPPSMESEVVGVVEEDRNVNPPMSRITHLNFARRKKIKLSLHSPRQGSLLWSLRVFQSPRRGLPGMMLLRTGGFDRRYWPIDVRFGRPNQASFLLPRPNILAASRSWNSTVSLPVSATERDGAPGLRSRSPLTRTSKDPTSFDVLRREAEGRSSTESRYSVRSLHTLLCVIHPIEYNVTSRHFNNRLMRCDGHLLASPK